MDAGVWMLALTAFGVQIMLEGQLTVGVFCVQIMLEGQTVPFEGLEEAVIGKPRDWAVIRSTVP